MRLFGLFLIAVLVGLFYGCETPSTSKQSLTPYVGASYHAGADGYPGDFVLYLAEGKQSGPSIQDATVTIDGVAAPWSSYGYYQLQPIPLLVPGSVHTLKISHPTAFRPITASVTVPSGPAPPFTVSPAPPGGLAKRDTAQPVTYALSPVAGAWPAAGVRVLLKGYNAMNQMTYGITSRPVGTANGVGTFPMGKADRVGFEVRNENSVALPGTTSDSVFRIDGDQVTKAGFDPLTDIAQYRMELRIEKSETASFMNMNASVRDKDWAYLTGVSYTVDGASLVEQSQKGYYFLSVAGAWAEGSKHPYSITDKAGRVLTGQLTMPSGTLTGVTYSPAKGVLSPSYTVAPPSGGWPQGSYVECRGIVAGSNWSTSQSPTGTETLLFSSDFIGKASSITFVTALRNVYLFDDYLSGSQISVTGSLSQW